MATHSRNWLLPEPAKKQRHYADEVSIWVEEYAPNPKSDKRAWLEITRTKDKMFHEVKLTQEDTNILSSRLVRLPLLILCFAGVFAEKRVNPEAQLEAGHPESDGMRSLSYACRALCTPIVVNGRINIRGEEAVQKLESIQAFMGDGMKRSEEFVAKYGAAIDAVAETLVAKGSLSGTEVSKIVSQHPPVEIQ